MPIVIFRSFAIALFFMGVGLAQTSSPAGEAPQASGRCRWGTGREAAADTPGTVIVMRKTADVDS